MLILLTSFHSRLDYGGILFHQSPHSALAQSGKHLYVSNKLRMIKFFILIHSSNLSRRLDLDSNLGNSLLRHLVLSLSAYE